MVVAYVPALHAGYVQFFSRYPRTPIRVLGRPFIDAFPRLNRDLRALAPDQAALALTAVGFEASVLEKREELKRFEQFILPDEDVSRDFAERYLMGKEVKLENIFLRWDGVFANRQDAIEPDRVVALDGLEREFMRDACQESKYSADWWRQIGGLLVRDGTVLTRGHIRHFPSDLALDIFGTPRITVDFGERPDLYISMHAEADVIAQAAAAGMPLKDASLYSTTFPCINCAFLIARSGIAHLYYSEGYSKIDAQGILKDAGVEIVRVEGL